MEFINNRNDSRRKKPEQKPLVDTLGRMQPRDKDVEEAVLGAIMLEKDAYTVVCDILSPQSFYEPENQKIYEAKNMLNVLNLKKLIISKKKLCFMYIKKTKTGPVI